MNDNAVASMEMPRYVSHKKVWALEIDTIGPQRLVEKLCDQGRMLTFRDAGYAPVFAEEGMFTRYVPAPGDFYVVYDDGYKSFSPRKAFLEGYVKLPDIPANEPARIMTSEQIAGFYRKKS